MNIALITAGGIGKRMGASIPKQFVEVNGKPIIIHTLDIFEDISDIDAIVISCVKEWIPTLNKMVEKYGIKKVKSIVEGGETGQDSIYNGLIEIEKLGPGTSYVLIHDGVRPLVKQETVIENIIQAKEKGNAVTCVPLTETVICNDNENYAAIDRNNSLIARAPQTFILKDLIEVHNEARKDMRHDFVDTCTLMLYYGKKISVVYGSSENIKITTPSDIFAFKSFLQKRESEYFLNQI